VDEPATLECLPVRQLWQVKLEPVDSINLPTAQLTQFAPREESWKRPALQALHTIDAMVVAYLPGEQSAQALEPEATAILPAAQLKQAAREPSVSMYWPGLQVRQDLLPMLGLVFPAGHTVQLVNPSSGWNFP